MALLIPGYRNFKPKQPLTNQPDYPGGTGP